MKYIRSVIFVLAGALSIFCGVSVGDLPIGEIVEFKEYGGDAYSGIQQAGAHTALNIVYLAKILKEGLSGILYVGGITLIACAIPTFKKSKETVDITPHV